MKTLLAALLCAGAVARADLVLLQQVEGGGQTGGQTIRIKGDLVRADMAQQISTIINAAGGDIVTLMHGPKTFLRIPAARARAMIGQAQKLEPGGAAPKLTATGQKEKIGAYECEIFTTTLGGAVVTYWIARDFPNYPAVLAEMAKLQAGGLSLMGKGLMPELKDFPGMPVRTDLDLGGKKVRTTLLSVRQEAVDPASFDIPKDYQDASTPLDLAK